MPGTLRIRVGALLCVGTLILLAMLLVANRPSNAGASPSEAAAARAEQQRLFPILRRSATADDQMPPDQARRLAGPQARVGDARVIATPYGKGWVIPVAAEDLVCLAVPDKVPGYGYTCASTREAAGGRLAGMLLSGPGDRSDRAVVVAVVPEGSEATAVRRDGRRDGLGIRDGVLSVALDAKRLELTTPQQAQPVVLDTTPIKDGPVTDCSQASAAGC